MPYRITFCLCHLDRVASEVLLITSFIDLFVDAASLELLF